MLSKQIRRVKEALDSGTTRDLMHAGKELLDTARKRPMSASQVAVDELAEHILCEDLERGAWVGIICGALVENGCDPDKIEAPVFQRLRELVIASGQLAEAALEQMADPTDADADEDDEDQTSGFDKALEEVGSAHPELVQHYLVLQIFWRPVMTLLERDAAARARHRDLRPQTRLLAPHCEAGHWLDQILAVLDDEPLLVLRPASQEGIQARMSGVADNFQLNMLLMADFPLPKGESPRLTRQAAAIARGEGPQSADDIVTAPWNLYDWQVLTESGQVPEDATSDSSHWIWNEGKPEDIPTFEGHRVVILGPASYPRSWRAQRLFEGLKASFAQLEVLDTDAVNDWLKRLGSAERP